MGLKEAIKKYQGKCYHGDYEGDGLVWVQIMKIDHLSHHNSMCFCYVNILLCDYGKERFRMHYNYIWFINDGYIEEQHYQKISFDKFLRTIKESGCQYDFNELTKYYSDAKKQRAKIILNYETE